MGVVVGVVALASVATQATKCIKNAVRVAKAKDLIAKEYPIGTKQTFKGKFTDRSEAIDFEWQPEITALSFSCKLAFPEETGNNWLTHEYENTDGEKPLDIEFQGAILAKESTKRKKKVDYQIEVYKMLSSKPASELKS